MRRILQSEPSSSFALNRLPKAAGRLTVTRKNFAVGLRGLLRNSTDFWPVNTALT